jgi:hypothetical protein
VKATNAAVSACLSVADTVRFSGAEGVVVGADVVALFDVELDAEDRSEVDVDASVVWPQAEAATARLPAAIHLRRDRLITSIMPRGCVAVRDASHVRRLFGTAQR